MSKCSSDDDEIGKYVRRSITDIARKCGVCDIDVIKTIKKIYK